VFLDHPQQKRRLSSLSHGEMAMGRVEQESSIKLSAWVL